MASMHQHPSARPPMPAVARILARYDRPALEGFISVAIGLLDVIDGDCDVELNGDEAEFNGDEIDYSVAGWLPGQHGADCEDREDDDAGEDDDGV